MNGSAAHLHTVLDGLPLRLESGESRQERRMDVHDAVRERLNELRSHEAHESGEAHESDVARTQLHGERMVVVIARRKGAMREHQRFDAGRTRPLKTRGIFPV